MWLMAALAIVTSLDCALPMNQMPRWGISLTYMWYSPHLYQPPTMPPWQALPACSPRYCSYMACSQRRRLNLRETKLHGQVSLWPWTAADPDRPDILSRQGQPLCKQKSPCSLPTSASFLDKKPALSHVVRSLSSHSPCQPATSLWGFFWLIPWV